jgi:uridine kinase
MKLFAISSLRLWIRVATAAADWACTTVTDTAIDRSDVVVSQDSIVVIDGCFLLRPELRGFWEFVMWLDISFETMIERALKRDVDWMPSEAVVRVSIS